MADRRRLERLAEDIERLRPRVEALKRRDAPRPAWMAWLTDAELDRVRSRLERAVDEAHAVLAGGAPLTKGACPLLTATKRLHAAVRRLAERRKSGHITLEFVRQKIVRHDFLTDQEIAELRNVIAVAGPNSPELGAAIAALRPVVQARIAAERAATIEPKRAARAEAGQRSRPRSRAETRLAIAPSPV